MGKCSNSGDELTLGLLGRQLRSLEDKFTEIEGLLSERKADGSAFSDEQTKQIKELIDERAEVIAGRAFIRLALWSAGAGLTGAASILFAYLKLKG